MNIREESGADASAIDEVTRQAFGEGLEVRIVQKIRKLPEYVRQLSLVAEDGGRIVGHVLLSGVSLEPDSGSSPKKVLGLGPISVVPERQRQGIGSELMRAAIDRARALGFDGIGLIGHPWYYPRFGFVPASRFGLRFTYDVPDDVAMALELRPGSLDNARGLLRFSAAFDE